MHIQLIPFTEMKAVIPIAGVGSRLFPATRVLPKPFFPLVDPRDGLAKPAIHLIVDEALRYPSSPLCLSLLSYSSYRSGVSEVCIVLHPSQHKMVHDYFFNTSTSSSWEPLIELQKIVSLFFPFLPLFLCFFLQSSSISCISIFP